MILVTDIDIKKRHLYMDTTRRTTEIRDIQYVDGTSVEEQARKINDTNELERLENEWFGILFPNWIYVSNFSSKTDLRVFCKILRATGLRPHELAHLPVYATITDKFINKSDVIAAKIGYYLRNDQISRTNILKADWYRNQDPGDTGLYHAETYKLDKDAVDNMLRTNGPNQIIKSEQKLHALLLIPASILLGFVIPALHSRYSDEAENHFPEKWVFIFGMVSMTVNLFLYVFSIAYATIQIFTSTLCAGNDILIAYYLNISLVIRFFGFCCYLFSILHYWTFKSNN